MQRQNIDTFPSKPDIHAHFSIPNLMWKVGCCVVPGGGVGTIHLLLLANQVFMSISTVTQVEQFIRIEANDPTIQLFPGSPDRYPANKQFYFNQPKK